MSTAEKPETPKRSPRYPQMNLSQAIDRVRAIYAADKNSGSPIQAALRHMGFKSRSGPANTVLAALKRFGLVDVIGERVILTKRAISLIVLPQDDPRRQDALREAALHPSLYRHLFSRYEESGNIPSQHSLEGELMLSGEYNNAVVPSIVKDFRNTLIVAGLIDENGVILTRMQHGESGGALGQQAVAIPPKVGDLVQWTSAGVDQFRPPRRVMGIDGDWAFVEGSDTGVLMSELTVVDARAEPQVATCSVSPPPNPYYKPKAMGLDQIEEKAGFALERRTLEEGPVVLQWPEKMGKDSVEEFEYWVKGLIRSARRKAGLPREPEKD